MSSPAKSIPRDGWTPAPPPRCPVLFVNPRSGGGKNQRAEIADRARARGIEVVLLTPDQDLPALVDQAINSGADALGVAGGDGSLAIVAAAAAANGIPFVCVPAGTRNHFAADVGVDRHDLVGALDAFGDGFERRIDMAAVNGRALLNNVSIGVYGMAVQRTEYRNSKVRTILRTALEVFVPGGQATELHLTDDAGHGYHNPAMLVISNNPYAPDRPPGSGMRPRLDLGQLGIMVIYTEGQGRRLRGATWVARSIELRAATSTICAGIDGEPVSLVPPVSLTSQPAVLRVRVSPSQAHATSLRLRADIGPGHLPGESRE